MKKILSIIISLIILSSMIISTSANLRSYVGMNELIRNKGFKVGDVDDNDLINAIDSYLLKAYIAGENVEINLDSADFDLSNSVNAKDNLYLKACLSGTANVNDFETSYAIDLLSIAGNPISEYEIVLNDDFIQKEDNATIAAALLEKYIFVSTGYEINDVIGEDNRTKPYMIRLNIMAPESEEGINSGLGLEDYIYEVKDGNLYIYATLRGGMYAAYEILENYLGFRFFDAYQTYEYEYRVSDIPEGTYIHHVTKTDLRFSGQNVTLASLDTHYYANRMNSTTIYGGCDAKYGYQTGPVFDNAHSFGSCYQMGKGYNALIEEGKTDEEIRSDLWKCFAKGKELTKSMNFYMWQPCASDFGEGSDYDIMFKGLLLALDMYKAMNYSIDRMNSLGILKTSFSICDNGDGCGCTICRAKMNGRKVKLRGEMKSNLLASGYQGKYTLSSDGYVQFEKEYFNGTYLELTNKCAREIQEYYPGANIWTIIYDFSMPATVRPEKNVSIMYCGHGCIQHALGTGGCGDNVTCLGTSNKINEVSMKWWADNVHAEGGSIWFWSYGVNYAYNFLATPCIYELYDNWQYLLNYCQFDGIYYEGCGITNNFEKLKGHLSNLLNWNPDMTRDEFNDAIKEYLMMYYGDGYEELYKYIDLQQQAGDATGACFITNHDRPWDMYSWQFLNEHYEEMRGLLETAYEKANRDDYKERIQMLIFSCDFMGLSSAYDRYYINGDAEHRKIFEDRLTYLYNYFLENNLETCEYYPLPDELDFSVCPMNLFYTLGAYNVSLIPPFAK